MPASKPLATSLLIGTGMTVLIFTGLWLTRGNNDTSIGASAVDHPTEHVVTTQTTPPAQPSTTATENEDSFGSHNEPSIDATSDNKLSKQPDEQAVLDRLAQLDPSTPISAQDQAIYDTYHLIAYADQASWATLEPYASLSNEALINLGYADPMAALLQGSRIDIPTEGDVAQIEQARQQKIDWYLRATALSGKSGPLLRLLARDFSAGTEVENLQSGQSRVMFDLDAMSSRASVEMLAAELGHPRARPNTASNDLLDTLAKHFPREDSQQWQARSKAQVNAMRERMTAIRAEVGMADIFVDE